MYSKTKRGVVPKNLGWAMKPEHKPKQPKVRYNLVQ